MELKEILDQYTITDYFASPLANGLINTTWMVATPAKKYILQKINQDIFKTPCDISYNIRLLSEYLLENDPGYIFTHPLTTKNGNCFLETNEGYFRLFDFVENTHTIDVVHTTKQAFEAAKQFGRFTRVLSSFDASRLKITIPGFHDLTLRYKQFEEALINGNKARIEASQHLISAMKQQKNIAEEYVHIQSNSDFTIRVTHHDTKISNVLFDGTDNGICVIDLDTVMPGYFISDVGDMIRSYVSPVNEEEKDFTRIIIRKEFLKAIVDGYLSEMENELTPTEKKYFIYAGKYMIYMQALRFLTDHLNSDNYYGSKYEGQNLIRAGNQATLLHKLMDAEDTLMI